MGKVTAKITQYSPLPLLPRQLKKKDRQQQGRCCRVYRDVFTTCLEVKASFSSVLLVCLLMLVSGCGFQLRGKVNLPAGVEPIFIGGINSSSQLAIELRNQLSAAGVQLSKESSTANYQLLVLKIDNDRRVTALGERARAIEYQLIESASYELRNAKGQVIYGPNKIVERHIMPNDPNKVISTNEEEKILRREMLQNLAAKIARQLQAYDFNNQTVKPDQ